MFSCRKALLRQIAGEGGKSTAGVPVREGEEGCAPAQRGAELGHVGARDRGIGTQREGEFPQDGTALLRSEPGTGQQPVRR